MLKAKVIERKDGRWEIEIDDDGYRFKFPARTFANEKSASRLAKKWEKNGLVEVVK